ncbi:MAG: hypothetical protein IK149_08610 [Oscillospiraceae bacterium]|nr:hypothetical protein [Oscillospiraceae bacterium]
MDELEGQIREVLGDPAQMAQIMGLAQSLLGGAPDEKPGSPPKGFAEKLGLPQPKPEGGAGDPQALLRALQPYLSDRRQRKLERALRITRMARLAKGALGGLGGAGDA